MTRTRRIASWAVCACRSLASGEGRDNDMAKSNAQIAAEVRRGGNLPGGMIFDPSKPADEQVRAKTAEEKKADTDAERAAAKLANDIEAAQPVSGGVNVEQ